MFKVSSLTGCAFLVRTNFLATFWTAERNALASLTESECIGDVNISTV
jgi:hypothetical protein